MIPEGLLSPSLTVLIDEAGGFDIIITPTHELGVVDYFIAFSRECLSKFEFIKGAG